MGGAGRAGNGKMTKGCKGGGGASARVEELVEKKDSESIRMNTV